MNEINITITPKQSEFINAVSDEVLFGGAAGGGKSYGQVMDALIYALKYPGSKQIIFRRTFPELEKSIIRTVLETYPQSLFKYNSSAHTGRFANGSILDFGYCDSEKDVYKYQSAEFDVIRFDELTHFTEEIYTYLISRLRGTKPFPRSVKSSTNPGGVGHIWVKERFIDIGEADVQHRFNTGTRIFIPSKVQDNFFLMQNDKDYVRRLENLDGNKKRALLYGDWDLTEGKFFTEFDREKHVVKPFEIPEEWLRYRAIDYGLDCFACLWIAVNSLGECFVYREYAKKDMVISEGSYEVVSLSGAESIKYTYAPPDLWGRSQESGKSRAEIFRKAGLRLTKSDNNRADGLMCIKEMLNASASGDVKLKIFASCKNLIKHLSEIQTDEKNPDDCATQPHDITHLPDALRYFAIMHYKPPKAKEKPKQTDFDFQKPKKGVIGGDYNSILRR